MKLIALTKTNRSGVMMEYIHEGYTSKKKYKTDLRRNGYRVIMVLTEKDIAEIKEDPFHPLMNGVKYRVYEFIKQVL